MSCVFVIIVPELSVDTLDFYRFADIFNAKTQQGNPVTVQYNNITKRKKHLQAGSPFSRRLWWLCL